MFPTRVMRRYWPRLGLPRPRRPGVFSRGREDETDSWEARLPIRPALQAPSDRDIVRCDCCPRSLVRHCMAHLVLTRADSDGGEVTRNLSLCPDCRAAFELLTRTSMLDRISPLFQHSERLQHVF